MSLSQKRKDSFADQSLGKAIHDKMKLSSWFKKCIRKSSSRIPEQNSLKTKKTIFPCLIHVQIIPYTSTLLPPGSRI